MSCSIRTNGSNAVIFIVAVLVLILVVSEKLLHSVYFVSVRMSIKSSISTLKSQHNSFLVWWSKYVPTIKMCFGLFWITFRTQIIIETYCAFIYYSIDIVNTTIVVLSTISFIGIGIGISSDTNLLRTSIALHNFVILISIFGIIQKRRWRRWRKQRRNDTSRK